MATEEETLSLQLYDYLCEKVGSEKTVFARRLWYKVNDDCKNVRLKNRLENIYIHINSGSKAEGLDFEGSDLDVMKVLSSMVYNHRKSALNSHLLCYDTETSQPGFCKIRICKTNMNEDQSTVFRKFGTLSDLFVESAVFTDTDVLVSSDKFKQFFFRVEYKPYLFKFHGPCLSHIDDSLDIAYCLRCPLWPSEASTWITRHNLSAWPSANIISNILHEGVLFVPIGPSTEWRISFSVGEMLLIHSFNHTQLLCYAILKLVLKEVIDDVPGLQNLLCSYFMKTVVFWVSEESDTKDWTPQRLLSCFQQCMKRLLYFVKCGYCPNYFMPDNNMFKNKIYGKYQRNLDSFLTELYEGGILYVVMCCKSLYGFHNNMIFTTNIDKDRGVYPLLNKFTDDQSPFFISQILSRAYYAKTFVPKLAMPLYLVELAKIIPLITTIMT